MGCFKIVATPAYLRSNFQTSLNYGVRLFQNTCFDFFHSPSEDCLDCFQVLLSYYLIDSYWYVGLYIYFKIYFFCVCVNVRVWVYREHVEVRGQLFWPLFAPSALF